MGSKHHIKTQPLILFANEGNFFLVYSFYCIFFARPAKLRVFALIVKTLFSKLGIKSYLRAQFHFRKQDYGI